MERDPDEIGIVLAPKTLFEWVCPNCRTEWLIAPLQSIPHPDEGTGTRMMHRRVILPGEVKCGACGAQFNVEGAVPEETLSPPMKSPTDDDRVQPPG